ncbi:MAG: MFS transporter [Desulfosarcinaceae bacterium]
MQDFAADCPMPVPLREKVSLIFLIAWLFFLSFVTRIMFAPLMPAIENDLGISHAQAGGLFLMISLGYLMAPLCAGLIASKVNHRGTLKASVWLVGLALVPFLLVEKLWAVRLLLATIGFSAGIHLPSAIATITAEVRREDWGKALSIHQSAPPLSFVCAPLVATLLMNWLSWRGVLATLAGIILLSAVAYTWRGRGGDFPGKPAGPRNVRFILTRPSFYLMVLLFAMAIGGNAGIYAMLPLYLVNERAMDLARANTLIGLSQISGLMMVFMAGWITDRIGPKRTMGIVLTCGGLCTLLIGQLHGGWLVAIIFIQPALVSSFFPSGFASLSRIAPPSMRSVTNALGPPSAFLVGGGLLPTLIGYFGETYTFGLGITLVGAFMLLSPLLVFFLKLGQYDNQAGC